MFVLKLLGGAIVEGEGGPLSGRAAHRRRLALLALLATAPSGRLGREKVAAHLWPEREAERARHLISESLYVLRKALGEGAFLTSGDEVGLNPEVVTSDVAAFEAALAAGELEAAVALYRGPFLDGFFVDGAAEFERWAEAERDRLAHAYAGALERLAEGREEAGDWLTAASWWRRLAAHDPFSSRVALRLMQALDAAGERAAALQHAATHNALLEAELGVGADPEVAAFEARLRSAPEPAEPPADLPIRPAASLPATPAPEPTAAGSQAPARRSAPPRPQRRRFVALALLAAVLVGLGVFYPRPETSVAAGSESGLKPTRIAVLFFDDYTPAGELGYLANGLTASLIHELSRIETLEVISENGVAPFRGQNVTLDSIARTLGAGTLVTGSLSRYDDRLRVNVRVIDATTSVNLQSQVQERPWSETFGLIDDVVREVSFALRRELGQRVQIRGWQAGTNSVEAWQLVHQADELRTRALAQYGAGERAGAAEQLEEADRLLEQAETLDPRWPEPIIARGWIANVRGFAAFHPAHRDPEAMRRWFSEGIRHADRAIAIAPKSARALELRGILRMRRTNFDLPENPAEAERQLRLAEADLRAAAEIDPLRARAWSELSTIEFNRGDFLAAKRAAEQAYRADAFARDVATTLFRLFETSFELGEDDEAARWCDELRPRFESNFVYVHCALTLSAWAQRTPPDPDSAWALVERSLAATAPAHSAVMRPRLEMLIAGVLARAGQTDSAQAVLQRASATTRDPDLLAVEAGVRVLLYQHDRAVALLRSYGDAHPMANRPTLQSRRFAAVRNHSDYPVLAATPRAP